LKFSKSLLSNNDIRQKLFLNGVEKSKELLKYIFGIDFNLDDLNAVADEKEFTFSLIFKFGNALISAKYSLHKENDTEILQEILEIVEKDESSTEVYLTGNDKRLTNNDYWDSLKKVQDYLESRFDINFTPLDPSDKDKRILELNYDEENKFWETKFIQDHQEGYFTATYTDCRNLKLIHWKIHTIVLD